MEQYARKELDQQDEGVRLDRSEEKRGAKGQTIGKTGKLSCVGNVYVDDNGNVRVDMSKSGCPDELIEAIVKSTSGGKEVIFDVGRRRKKI
jgi:hypothetical protein